MSRYNLAWLIGICAVSLFGFAIVTGAPSREQEKNYELVDLIVDVLEEVDQRYVNPLTPERKRRLVEDMLNGGLERLDPHSAYINPQELQQFNKQTEGRFGGVGIQISTDRNQTGRPLVISPMPGTPAYEAGVLAGDLIMKIDGKSTENMRLNETIDLIQGDPGDKVTLTVRHETGKIEDIDIVRAIIEVKSVLGDQRKKENPAEWDFMLLDKEKIGYLRLVQFNQTATEEITAAIKELKAQGMKGLVIDLRSNPGGLLRAAINITDLFIDEGAIVSTKGRNHREESYRADSKSTILGPDSGVPIAVLINRYSASASEIFSAALQDHGRAIVVGERSYGKGSVQNVILLEENSSALKLTTASYWRPSGKNIHRFPESKESDEWGVHPSKGYELKLSDEERLKYILWRNARDIVRDKNKKVEETTKDEKKENEKKENEKKFDLESYEDPVMKKALDYLRDEMKKAALRPAIKRAA